MKRQATLLLAVLGLSLFSVACEDDPNDLDYLDVKDAGKAGAGAAGTVAGSSGTGGAGTVAGNGGTVAADSGSDVEDAGDGDAS